MKITHQKDLSAKGFCAAVVELRFISGNTLRVLNLSEHRSQNCVTPMQAARFGGVDGGAGENTATKKPPSSHLKLGW